MALVEWNSELSVAIPAIDEEHKKLIGMINSLHEAMKTGKGKERLAELFDEACEYAANHFAHEEQLMLKSKYPGYSNHKKEHEAFVREVGLLREQLHGNNCMLSSQMLKFLRDWAVNHIGSMDKKYCGAIG